MSNALIIFVRNPERGKVKTRLAATLGEDKALKIYRELLRHTLQITKNAKVEKYVFYAGAIPQNDAWKENGFHQLLQKEADLGEKMQQAFETVLKQHSKAVIIGSDCPELTEEIIQDAFAALENHDVTIGPANDGGYYLLGMKKIFSEFFRNKRWSTEEVYAKTLKDFSALHLSYYELPALIDIDTEEDWEAVQQKNIFWQR